LGQVSVTLNGRTYRLECGAGEEAHLIALSEYLGSHVDTMKQKFGQVGDDRLILMAALMVTDELWERERQVQELKSAMTELKRDKSAADDTSKSKLVGAIGAAAERLEMLNRQLSESAGGEEPDKPQEKVKRPASRR
jgi:cell division protein ZapA